MENTLVYNIQRFSTHDGAGIRTVVFLKGCPLRCEWCSNPESQSFEKSIFFNPMSCIGCGKCMHICKFHIQVGRQGQDPDCTHCGLCARVCPAKALECLGEEKTITEVLKEVEKDASFYRQSGGGVTVSGGEPLMHPEYVIKLAKEIKKSGYNLALETTGFAKWETAKAVFDNFDLLLYDIKHMDDEIHKKYTGVSNKLILENARKAAREGYNIIFRVPLMGGINATDDNITKLGDFAAELGIKEIHFLPYHTFGEYKYKYLRRKYETSAYKPEKEDIERLAKILEDKGISVNVGG